MKKIMMIMVALGLTMAVDAQRGHGGARVVVVSGGLGFGYSPFLYSPYGYLPFGYSPFGYPYGMNSRRMSKLDMKVEDIKADYKDKIRSAKQDKTLSREERKNIVHQLKTDRDKTVHDLKANYYKPQQRAPDPAEKG